MKPERSLHYNVTPYWSDVQAAYALNAGVRTKYEGWVIVARGRACGSDIGLKCKVSLHLVCLLFTLFFFGRPYGSGRTLGVDSKGMDTCIWADART